MEVFNLRHTKMLVWSGVLYMGKRIWLVTLNSMLFANELNDMCMVDQGQDIFLERNMSLVEINITAKTVAGT
jgi:hypothetical protein